MDIKLHEHLVNNINYDIQTVYRTKCFYEHWGDENFVPSLNKLYLILDGTLFFNVDDTSFEAKKGDLLLLPLHSRQTFYSISETFDHYYCHFKIPVDKSVIDLFNVVKCPYKITLSPEMFASFKQQFEQLKNLYAEKRSLSNQFNIYGIFNRMIALYMDQAGDPTPMTPNPHLIEMMHIMDYINVNMHRIVSLNELADQLHLHPNYFIRLFKTHFGQPPIKYITTLKMKKACELLLLQEKSVSHIAEELGYSDIFYFSRLFKQHTGKSPSAYRKH